MSGDLEFPGVVRERLTFCLRVCGRKKRVVVGGGVDGLPGSMGGERRAGGRRATR